MARLVHQLIGIATALALVVSSAGWSMASVRAGLDGPAMHHSAVAGGDAGHHHAVAGAHASHDNHAVDPTKAGLCDPAPSDCGSAVPADEDASSCCAMACHVAVPTSSLGIAVVRHPTRLALALPAHGLPWNRETRLERPPRRVA